MTSGATIRKADDNALREAARLIRAGRLVAFPTETVYGLGADATSDWAVAAIFEAKGRPHFNPLIIHVTDRAAAERLVVFDDQAAILAQAFWPGALTLVLPRRPDCPVSLLAGAGLDTLAVRVPAHPVARTLLALARCPIAAPSANRSGSVSPTTARHVWDSLGTAVDLILDGGPSTVGIESTVIDLSGDRPALLRPGGIPAEDISAIIGPLDTPDTAEAPRSPGMLERHYAPDRPLRMDVTDPQPGEAVLAFGPNAPAGSLNLSPAGDPREAAANLFSYLRQLDRPGVRGIAVMPIPETGLGRAINDRLRRAKMRENSTE